LFKTANALFTTCHANYFLVWWQVNFQGPLGFLSMKNKDQ